MMSRKARCRRCWFAGEPRPSWWRGATQCLWATRTKARKPVWTTEKDIVVGNKEAEMCPAYLEVEK